MAGVNVVVSGGGTIVASVDGQDSSSIQISGTSPVDVQVTGGVGPAAAVDTNSGVIVGVNPILPTGGTNVTVSGSTTAYSISGVSDSYIASKAPIQSVQGRSGAVVLTRADLTAAASVHTHGTSDVSGFTAAVQSFANVRSVQGRTGDVVLSRIDLTAASSSHTHAASDVSGLPVTSVQGRTGSVVLVLADLSAAASSHTHSVGQISGIPVTSVQGRTGNVVVTIADLSAAGASHTHNFPVTSVQSKTGNVVLTLEDIPHEHSYVQSLSTITGNVSVVGSGGVTVTTAGSSITVYSSPLVGIQWGAAPSAPGADGSKNSVAYDNDFLYVAVDNQHWRRVPFAQWVPTDPLFSSVLLLLHFNNAEYDVDLSSSIIDSSSYSRQATKHGNAAFSTETKRFGNSGAWFFTGSYLSFPASSDWDIGSDKFAVEFWLYVPSGITQPSGRTRVLGTDGWGFYFDSATNSILWIEKGSEGQTISEFSHGGFALNQWTYIVAYKDWTGLAFLRVGLGYTGGYFSGDVQSLGSPLTIGGTGEKGLHCYIDEVRITSGSGRYNGIFNVYDPVAPTAPFPDA